MQFSQADSVRLRGRTPAAQGLVGAHPFGAGRVPAQVRGRAEFQPAIAAPDQFADLQPHPEAAPDRRPARRRTPPYLLMINAVADHGRFRRVNSAASISTSPIRTTAPSSQNTDYAAQPDRLRDSSTTAAGAASRYGSVRLRPAPASHCWRSRARRAGRRRLAQPARGCPFRSQGRRHGHAAGSDAQGDRRGSPPPPARHRLPDLVIDTLPADAEPWLPSTRSVLADLAWRMPQVERGPCSQAVHSALPVTAWRGPGTPRRRAAPARPARPAPQVRGRWGAAHRRFFPLVPV